MNQLTREINGILRSSGADLSGVGDLTGLPAAVRYGLPTGICVAVKFPKEVIQGISELPTQEYCNWYHRLNERLDRIVTTGAEHLTRMGYHAVAQTRAQVGDWGANFKTLLPHKTVATRAGIGWIGKSALLVTKAYGSMIRLSSILTDAPLTAAEPVDHSECGSCMVCTKACPAGAISGRAWEVSLYRDAFFSPEKCCETARKRSAEGFGIEMSICGKCIEACPHTQKYLQAP